MPLVRMVVAGVALIAAISLASCSSTESCPNVSPTPGSHTLLMWSPRDTPNDAIPECKQHKEGPVTSGWVSALPAQDAVDLWTDLTGEQLPEADLERATYRQVPEEPLNQLILASTLSEIGPDGGADLDITPGRYLVCYGDLQDTPVYVVGCICADLGEEQVVIGDYPRGLWPWNGYRVYCSS